MALARSSAFCMFLSVGCLNSRMVTFFMDLSRFFLIIMKSGFGCSSESTPVASHWGHLCLLPSTMVVPFGVGMASFMMFAPVLCLLILKAFHFGHHPKMWEIESLCSLQRGQRGDGNLAGHHRLSCL